MEWLHLALHRVGVDGDVDINELAERAGTASALPTVPIQLGPPALVDEGVVLWASPTERLAELRARLTCLPPQELPAFHPHVSLAYTNAEADPAGLADVLERIPEPRRVDVTVTGARLVRLHRVDHLYRWETIAAVPLS